MRAYIVSAMIDGVAKILYFYLRKCYGRPGIAVVVSDPTIGKLYEVKEINTEQPLRAIIDWLNDCPDYERTALLTSKEIKVKTA